MKNVGDWIRLSCPLLFALAWVLWSTQAQAQAYICAGGAGPDEHIVGWTGEDPKLPLCSYDGPAAPTPAPILTYAYASIAWHPDAEDLWIEGNYEESGVAQNRALDACNKVMGGGCQSSGEWRNSSMAMIRGADGKFYHAWEGERGAMRKQVLDECSARQLLRCEVFAEIRSNSRGRTPGTFTPKFYAAAVWVKDAAFDDGRLYVAAGHRNAKDAVDAGTKACEEANQGHPCALAALTGNGFIQASARDGGRHSVTVETSLKRVEEAARLNCKQLKSKTCTMACFVRQPQAGLVRPAVRADSLTAMQSCLSSRM